MSSKLMQIELENFKTFKGHTIIRPFQHFTAVIGPNGSGKSNFMDAICFVMGEKTQNLRVRTLRDLIHGAPINRPISERASVTAVFQLDCDGIPTEITFQRIIRGSSSEYQINTNIVTNQEYLQELKNLNLDVKSKNFLVFQGAVENISTRSSKEITTLIEQISGSGALKNDYEEKKKQKLEANDQMNHAYQKKKIINRQRKEAKIEKDMLVKYTKEKEKYTEALLTLQLFRLFHNEKDIEILEKSKPTDVADLQEKLKKAEGFLKEKKKEVGEANRNLEKIQQDIRDLEAEKAKTEPGFVTIKEKVNRSKANLQRANKLLQMANDAYKNHKKDICKLQEELKHVETISSEYEKNITQEYQSQGIDIHLEASQLQEYNRLKIEAAKRTSSIMAKLDSLKCCQRDDQDKLDNATSLRAANLSMYQIKEMALQEAKKQVEKINECILKNEQALNEQCQLRDTLQTVESSVEQIKEIEKALKEVLEELGTAHSDKYEDARMKSRQEIITNLKANFPGVYDRMNNLCKPKEKRYDVAVTKVFGKYIDAIVVDHKETAMKCIEYLKRRGLGRETFLALSFLSCHPTKELSKNARYPKGTKLIYNVLNFNDDISRAICFVAKNTVVCELPEDACQIASKDSRNAVSLDGSYFHKSGIISGGRLDIALKAKKWDENRMTQLKIKKEKLTEELREALKMQRKAPELKNISVKILEAQIRLEDAKSDKEQLLKEISSIEAELQILQQNTNLTSKIENINKNIKKHEKNIKAIEKELNVVEDEIFLNFCQKIGVSNIRQYEGRELRLQEERRQKRYEFANQIDKINGSLEFAEGRLNTDVENMTRWKKAVKDEEAKLKSNQIIESKQIEDRNKIMAQLENLKEQLKKDIRFETKEQEVHKAKKAVEAIDKQFKAAKKQLDSILTNICIKKHERRYILKECKMEDIEIPMLNGNMSDICFLEECTPEEQEREDNIQIDYKKLSRDYRNVGQNEFKKLENELKQDLESRNRELMKYEAPNVKVNQKMESLKNQLQSFDIEYNSLQRRSKAADEAFEAVKKQRFNLFTECFDHISKEIDSIYKDLCEDNSAQAFLVAENAEQPYLEGITYNCVVPGKRFLVMSSLSGGEKTVAALALLFAIQTYQQAPFFVLDEIDAALDSTNIEKVASFIRRHTQSLQMILISLKKEFFCNADLVIGVYPLARDCIESNISMTDLRKYS